MKKYVRNVGNIIFQSNTHLRISCQDIIQIRTYIFLHTCLDAIQKSKKEIVHLRFFVRINNGYHSISMSAIVCIECKTLPTKHTCKVCKTPICPQCCNNRGLTDLNLMLCSICQNKNDTNKSTGNESSSFGNTTMSTKQSTQFPTPLPKGVVKPTTTCGGSPSLSVTVDVNRLESLNRLPETPDAMNVGKKLQCQ